MRKALLLTAGVAVTFVAAVFVGAAAATTGAPIFYDARIPQPAPTAPDGYDVGEGPIVTPEGGGAADEADSSDGEPLPPPPGGTAPPAAEPTPTPPPPAAPPTDSPDGATPTPTPIPTPSPTPDPNAPSDELPVGDAPQSDELAPGAPEPGSEPPTPDEQATWLAFQQVVRECMAGAGQQYLYWEWWNPGPDISNRFPAMPAGLTADEFVVWTLALHGETGVGTEYRWEDAGCWGAAVHATGGTN